MSDELKPCPFCGGEAEHFGGGGNHCIRCTVCEVTNETLKRGSMVFDAYRTAEEAAAAWNARAAVADEQFSLAVNDGEAWQKVRTCGQPRGFIPCDSDSFGSMSFAELWCEHCDIELDPEWQFCPSCGAKIEGESR